MKLWLNKLAVITIAALTVAASLASAQTSTQTTLEQRITEHNKEIARLEQEIAQYEKKLTATSAEAKNLKGELDNLELTRKKLLADIELTEQKIQASQIQIQRLDSDIDQRDNQIVKNQNNIRGLLRTIRRYDQVSAVEMALAYDHWSDLWRETDNLIALQENLVKKVHTVAEDRANLNIDREDAKTEQIKLNQLKNKLSDQETIVAQNRTNTKELLDNTKNEETNYKKLLADRQKKKEAFEKELFEFEAQLKIIIDPGSLPPAGSGVLRWPLDSIFITQNFGKTVDARRLYASGTHNGVDFRAAVGTPVKAALQGRVIAAGDTDQVCPKASYGKWVLIEHGNGLSTLYAHLSLIKVTGGQNVSTGEVIAYSGNTGYTTGPHLHLTVYASQGVEVIKRSSQVCRGTYTLPVAPPGAYLDPLIYL